MNVMSSAAVLEVISWGHSQGRSTGFYSGYMDPYEVHVHSHQHQHCIMRTVAFYQILTEYVRTIHIIFSGLLVFNNLAISVVQVI